MLQSFDMPRHLRLALLLLLFPKVAAANEAGPVTLVGESRPTAARLEEARKRLAAGKPAEAVAVLQAILDAGANELVPVGPGRSVSAALLAQGQLARLPAEERQRYRKRIDAQARNWLQQADRTGQGGPLRRLVRDAFLSPHALTALDRLGDRAFARGEFDEAERWWAAIVPLEPAEPPAPETLRYPDPPADLVPRLRAKQLLARRFRGAAGWPDDLARFQARHPEARGTLAGRSGRYTEILTAVAASLAPPPANADWPTFGGAPGRNRVESAPPRLLDRLSLLCRAGPTWRFDLETRKRQTTADLPSPRSSGEVDAARRLAFFPVVTGHVALVADARHITAYDLRSGEATVWYDAAAYVGGLKPRLTLPAAPDLRYTLTVAEDCVFARLGTQTVRDIRLPAAPGAGLPALHEDAGESVLVSLSLQPGPDGDRRRWMVRAADPGRKELAVFEGAPVVRDGRVYIAATRFEGDRVVTAIHCYPAHPEDSTAPLLWRTDVCETRELLPATAAAEADPWLRQRARHHLLTLANDQVVYCSHSGAVVALDARTGMRTWGIRYPRRDPGEPADEPRLRDLAPPLFADGRLYVAPADTDHLYCLDPETGATIWERDGLDVVHLAGVAAGRLIFTTWRPPYQGQLFAGGLRAVDAADGGDSGGWALPDDGGGLLPFGRPLLVGDLVLWPTARQPYGVFAVRQTDGLQPDNPSLLHRIPSGNLLHANGILLVADGRTLHAFVPPELLADELKSAVDEGRMHRSLDRVRSSAARGDHAGALARLTAVAWKTTWLAPGHTRSEQSRQVQTMRREVQQAALRDAIARRQPVEAELLLAALRDAPPPQELAALLTAARSWAAAGDKDRAAACWRAILDRPELRQQTIDDVTGLPQQAGWIATRELASLDGTTASATDEAAAPRPGGSAAPSNPATEIDLPLRPVAEVQLAAGETCLLTEADRVLCGRRGEAVARRLDDGAVVWRCALPFTPVWASAAGACYLLGGDAGVAAIEAQDGARVWDFLAPSRRRYPADPDLSVPDQAAPPLTAFQRQADRLVVVQGERRLLCLEARTGRVRWQRWAPGAHFEMAPPRGRFLHLLPLGDELLLTQASGRLWLLDGRSGTIRRDVPTTVEAWPRPPVVLAADRVSIITTTRIDVLAVPSGQRVWSHVLAADTQTSGAAPLVVPAGANVLVIEPRNLGGRLRQLALADGRIQWTHAEPLRLVRLDQSAWAASDDAVFCADAGEITALAVPGGQTLWRRALAGDGPWRLRRDGATLLAWPAEAAALRIGFAWLSGSVQYRIPAWQQASAWSLDLIDAGSGELLERINLDRAGRSERVVRGGETFRDLWPRAILRTDGDALPATVTVGAPGCRIVLGDRVRVLQSSRPTSSK